MSYTPYRTGQFGDYTHCGALYEKGLRYRYTLTRAWDGGAGNVIFICMNPSTATELEDDPTIKRCVNFAKDWGFHSYTLLNVMAYRSTDPSKLPAVEKAIGPQNLTVIERHCSFGRNGAPVIIAWGNRRKGYDAAYDAVEDILRRHQRRGNITVSTLGTNKTGDPKHPLYLRKDTEVQPWEGRRG